MQVCLSGYMAVAAATYAYAAGYGVVCNEFDPAETRITTVQWLFYVSKAVDFLDTVFIIARRNWRQFSFLHTYHHASIFAVYWMVAVSAYTGDVWAPVMANSLVHLVMYGYYLLASVGIKPTCVVGTGTGTGTSVGVPPPPNTHPAHPCRWGRYLTQFQMAQFVFMLLHGAAMLALECPYPRRVALAYVSYIAVMLLLFAQFYVRKYLAKPKAA